MCPFYNAQLFEITGTTKGVFTHSQSSCHIAKVVLAFSHDSRQIPIASDAPPRHTSRGFLHWRLSDDGPGASRIVPDGRHPKPFTRGDIAASACDVRNVPIRPVAVTAPFFDCPGITDEIYDCPCSLFVERPTPCARTYANQSVEDSRQVALIAEAARQGHIR